MKKSIKIHFTDFWQTFKPDDNIFYNFLKKHYNVILSPENPEYLIFSVFGTKFEEYNCTRILFSGENISPDFLKCDYAFCFSLPEGSRRIYRLPQYYQYGDMKKLTEQPDYERILKEKTKFCNFVYSNPSCRKRNEFFKKLSKYKKVDSAGRFMNNTGSYLPGGHLAKREFLKPYKFTIAFENVEAPFYTSEKIFEAMYVNSIPVYWGNPFVHIDFNPKSFLNYYDYGSEEALIEKIIELDKDDDKYIQLLKEPFFHNNEVNEFVKEESIRRQFEYIFNNEIEPVSASSPVFRGSRFSRTLALQKIRAENRIKDLFLKANRFSYDKLKVKYLKMIHGRSH